MNIILRELRAHSKSLLIWVVSMFAVSLMWTAEFSAYYKNPEMLEILDAIPQAMLEAFFMANANFTTLTGFISVVIIYYYIMLGAHAVLLGSNIISKEERDKTTEFFLTLPISRQKVLLCKFASSMIISLMINVACIASIYVFTTQYEKEAGFNTFMLLIALAMFLIQMIFVSMGMFISALVKQFKKSSSYAVSILTVLYLLSVIFALSEDLDYLKYVTPFKYFEPYFILTNNALDGTYVVISVVFTLVMVLSAYIVYPKRDLRL